MSHQQALDDFGALVDALAEAAMEAPSGDHAELVKTLAGLDTTLGEMEAGAADYLGAIRQLRMTVRRSLDKLQLRN